MRTDAGFRCLFGIQFTGCRRPFPAPTSASEPATWPDVRETANSGLLAARRVQERSFAQRRAWRFPAIGGNFRETVM
jgi:hypothetical protein